MNSRVCVGQGYSFFNVGATGNVAVKRGDEVSRIDSEDLLLALCLYLFFGCHDFHPHNVSQQLSEIGIMRDDPIVVFGDGDEDAVLQLYPWAKTINNNRNLVRKMINRIG